MKVKDIMQGSPIFIEEDFSLKKLAYLIFSSGVSGVPIVDKQKRVVGIVTQEDIFSRIHDSSGKKIDNKKLQLILEEPVKNIMIKNPLTILPETDLVEAQLLMYKNSFAQLPVVGSNKELMGIITHSDVFKCILEEDVPQLELNNYAAFVLENYDQMVDWEKRFDMEFPTLFRIFNRNNVKNILDLGFWTGEYSIGLVKEGMDVVGVDHNSALVTAANEKLKKFPANIKKKITFKLTNYKDLETQFSAGSFGAVICMGGALPYLPIDSVSLLKSAHRLIKKNGVFVLQLMNLERVMTQRKRFLYFRIKKSEHSHGKEELYIEYFDQKNEHTLTQNIVSFVSDGKQWIYKGINSIDIKYIKNSEVEGMVKEAGFKDIVITGNKGEEEGQYGHMSMIKPFDSVTSEWMTVFAHT